MDGKDILKKDGGWLRMSLRRTRFKVIVPAMPDFKHPQMGEWVGHLTNGRNPDEGCFFVGHSLSFA